MKSIALKSIAVIGIGIACAASASAGDTAVASNPSAAVAADGLRVMRDKATGRLRAPTADEARALDAAAAKSAPQALVITEHANGMKSARLTDEYLMSLEAQAGHGGLRVGHADGSHTTTTLAIEEK